MYVHHKIVHGFLSLSLSLSLSLPPSLPLSLSLSLSSLSLQVTVTVVTATIMRAALVVAIVLVTHMVVNLGAEGEAETTLTREGGKWTTMMKILPELVDLIVLSMVDDKIRGKNQGPSSFAIILLHNACMCIVAVLFVYHGTALDIVMLTLYTLVLGQYCLLINFNVQLIVVEPLLMPSMYRLYVLEILDPKLNLVILVYCFIIINYKMLILHCTDYLASARVHNIINI